MPAAVLDDEVTNEFVARPSVTRGLRIKGTWKMYWGDAVYDLEDWRDSGGKTFDLPIDLGEYLKATGNVYDTYS